MSQNKFRLSTLDASYNGYGYYGALWTSAISTTCNNYPSYVSFSDSGYTTDQGDAAQGRPVRCIKVE